MIGQTLGVKLVSLIANVVLAWFIAPQEAGLVGMAYTVLSLAGIIQYIGMQDVLVQRQAHFRRWSNPAFWMLLAVGLAGGALTALAAPVAAMIYGQPHLIGMILLLALACPLQTTSLVPQARLASQLRFRMGVVIDASAAIGSSVLSIILAALGCGAYSFVIPVPIMAALHSAASWWIARPAIHRSPQFHLWKYLVADTSFNWGASVCLIVITTADHVVLSLLYSPAVVGIYFWSINLSTQLLRLLSTNLTQVLLPSLSKLQSNSERQTNALLQAARILAALGIPACLLQAAVARPLVSILYKDDWQGVAPVLAVLSVGMAFYLVSGPAMSMIKAQGRFRDLFRISIANAVIMIAVVIALAVTADEETAALRVAAGCALCLAAFGPLYLHLALWPSAHRWPAVGLVYAGPTIAGVLAIATARAISRLIPDVQGRDYLELALLLIVTAALYPLLIRWIDRDVWRMTVERLKTLQRRSAPGSEAAILPLE